MRVPSTMHCQTQRSRGRCWTQARISRSQTGVAPARPTCNRSMSLTPTSTLFTGHWKRTLRGVSVTPAGLTQPVSQLCLSDGPPPLRHCVEARVSLPLGSAQRADIRHSATRVSLRETSAGATRAAARLAEPLRHRPRSEFQRRIRNRRAPGKMYSQTPDKILHLLRTCAVAMAGCAVRRAKECRESRALLESLSTVSGAAIRA
jgi:hypothetical protein